MKHTDIQNFCRPVVISMILFFGLLVLSGCIPVSPRHRTYPPEAANYTNLMASVKFGQTTLQELRPRLGSPSGIDYQDSKMHGVCCRWNVEYSVSASMAFGWKEGGRDWFYEPGEHMLMMEFDEADRLRRFEFQTASNWQECELVFRQWLQPSKHESK